MATTIWTKGNNKGKGFYYMFTDGTTGWIYGLGKAELKVMENKHGKLVKYVKA